VRLGDITRERLVRRSLWVPSLLAIRARFTRAGDALVFLRHTRLLHRDALSKPAATRVRAATQRVRGRSRQSRVGHARGRQHARSRPGPTSPSRTPQLTKRRRLAELIGTMTSWPWVGASPKPVSGRSRLSPARHRRADRRARHAPIPNRLEQAVCAASRASLENRYPSLGGSRVQIPPPPLLRPQSSVVEPIWRPHARASPAVRPNPLGSVQSCAHCRASRVASGA
jgi:hypothetical protein